MQEPDSWAGRIDWIVNTFCDGNRSTLARRIGLSTEAISGMVLRGSVPGGDKLDRIIRAFPRINPDWLLTGMGPRERDYQPPATPTDAQVAIQEIVVTLARSLSPDAVAEALAKHSRQIIREADDRPGRDRQSDSPPPPSKPDREADESGRDTPDPNSN